MSEIVVRVQIDNGDVYARVSMSIVHKMVLIHASNDGVTWSKSCVGISLEEYPELYDLRDERGDWNIDELAALLCPAAPSHGLTVAPDDDTEELHTWEFVP